jgi:hypothetical protein
MCECASCGNFSSCHNENCPNDLCPECLAAAEAEQGPEEPEREMDAFDEAYERAAARYDGEGKDWR